MAGYLGNKAVGLSVTTGDILGDVGVGGNLLVGKTVQNIGTVGATVVSGQVTATADGADALRLNRLSSDGSILDLRKAGTTVGSIGAFGGDAYFGTGDTGLIAYDNGNAILPFNTATGAYADNSLDFGVATQRFKNAYLSGGVYLGGTGSANKLSDVETGTWTPTDGSGAGLTLSVNASSYTKIGRLCYIYTYITYPSTSNGSTQALGGLPFTTKGSATYAQLTVRVTSNTVSASNLTFQLATSSTAGIIHDGASGIVNSDLSAENILISGCYEVA